MEESIEQVRLFLDWAPDAMLIVDSTGDIKVANSQAVKMFGYTRSEFNGMKVDQLMPEHVRDSHVLRRAEFYADPEVRSMGNVSSLVGLTRSGQEVPVDVSLSPIQYMNEDLVVASVRDVSHRRQMEKDLEKARDTAENATEAKTRFLTSASHDLRQPLQSIGLYLSALTRLLDQPRALEISDKIHRSLDVMRELLDALLDISKLGSGSIEPAMQDIPIRDLFEKLIADNEPLAKEKGLWFKCSFPPCSVHSDPSLLQRILENFVSNAVRYTDTGGVEIFCELRGNFARIGVKDTGIGISEGMQEAIFDEYFQIDNQARSAGKGLGLGLSIVNYISQLLGHRVDVSSRVGNGSTFSVEVPLGESSSPSVSDHQSKVIEVQQQSALIVLFIDDDPAIIDAMTELFELMNIQLVSASDPEVAIGHIEAGIDPDILVTDYRLPGCNGVDVIHRVREITKKDLPAVIMTGDTSSAVLKESASSNYSVLHKPVDIDQLVALIDNIRK